MNVSALYMWEENELSNVEFIPEPSDYRIVSAADSATVGHQEGWRGEVLGWAPTPVPVISRPRRNKQRVANVGIFLILILVFRSCLFADNEAPFLLGLGLAGASQWPSVLMF